MAQTLEKQNGILERYVSSAGDDDDDGNDGGDNEEEDDHNDEKSETQLPVDKDDNHMIIQIMIAVTVIILLETIMR